MWQWSANIWRWPILRPLGFDSLFALEHHFTGYAMSPAPTQLLAYFAGRTRRIMQAIALASRAPC